MMPLADRIREQNEQDPGRVAHTRQEVGSSDFLAVGPALRIHMTFLSLAAAGSYILMIFVVPSKRKLSQK